MVSFVPNFKNQAYDNYEIGITSNSAEHQLSVGGSVQLSCWLLLAKETKLALSSSSGRGVVVFLRNRNSDVPLHYVAQGHSW